ncbi:MAG TPA: GNAT family N-acetyltransferase [Candidatus Limnocylindria bacterium]
MTGYAVGDLRPVHRDAVYRFLSQDAYWSEGLPRDVFDRSIENSLNFAAVAGEKVVGFARVVTDRATFAWLCDVFVLAEHRGKGVSKLLMDAVMAHRDLARVRNFMLATRDAHGLYAKYGFAPLAEPGRWMAIRRPYR